MKTILYNQGFIVCQMQMEIEGAWKLHLSFCTINFKSYEFGNYCTVILGDNVILETVCKKNET